MLIPILYLPTNDTFETMLISIASLIQNNGEKEFKLVLGLDSSFNEENIAKIKAICSKHSQIKEIVIHKINEDKLIGPFFINPIDLPSSEDNENFKEENDKFIEMGF